MINFAEKAKKEQIILSEIKKYYQVNKLPGILRKLRLLKNSCKSAEERMHEQTAMCDHAHRESLRNLIHYMAVRSFDIRNLQNDLSNLAISSQAHSEGYVLNNIQKTEFVVLSLMGRQFEAEAPDQLDQIKSRNILKAKSERLFGKARNSDETHIMVTLPSEASENYKLIHDLVKNGMRIARINTAHDDLASWEKMIANVRRAGRSLKRKVRIYMDLAGPKIRTVLMCEDPKGIQLKVSDKLKVLKHQDQITAQGIPAISISIPEIFDQIRKDERVIFDDGKFVCTVSEVSGDAIDLEIVYAAKSNSYLKNEKGVNLPDTDLTIPSLTEDDLEVLPFIIKEADMVGYSFVRKPEDVEDLYNRLSELGRTDIGVILKIETEEAFMNLPMLVAKAMRFPGIGLMVARGDLAVEMGFRRMAEVQEEMLWLAEAAHIPLIWATQVFENLVSKGIPTRAEFSDAVKSVRAECVMLNKGPYVTDAMKVLKDIDRRMSAHENKKAKRLRSLSIAKEFLSQF